MAQTGVLWIATYDVGSTFAASMTDFKGFPGILGTAPRYATPVTGPEMRGGLMDPLLNVRLPVAQMSGSQVASINLLINGSSLADGMTKLDALRNLITATTQVQIMAGWAQDRYCLATLQTFDGQPFIPGIIDGNFLLTTTWAVADGVAWAATASSVSLSTTAAACATGTAESYPVITITASGGVSLVNPTITLKNSAGTTVTTMGFTLTLASGDSLAVDCANCLVTKTVSGVQSDAISTWTSGDFPSLDPANAVFSTSSWQTLTLGKSSGTPTGTAAYTKRYT